jgi:hypothetical protein
MKPILAMSIPLDRLYHYIESIITNIRNDATIIYRFAPDGSKKLADLDVFTEHPWVVKDMSPAVYCYDQEPLNYEFYQNAEFSGLDTPGVREHLSKHNIVFPKSNLKIFHLTNIYDKALLLHSELRSNQVEKYRQDNFIPVYYWSHAIIARDWFRFAEHIEQHKSRTGRKPFLIYNRAWSGTREYRLKFVDLLIENNLQDSCQVTFNPIEPQDGIHYKDHKFTREEFKPEHALENYFKPTNATSSCSADFDLNDYNHSDFEIVLETLFDDSRLHFTEKILRPIACGHPFIVVGPKGSLQYLRQYGFQTFGTIIDESYDTIEDPVMRLEAIMKVMKTIANWTDEQRLDRIEIVKGILEYNKQLFFSKEFAEIITNELKLNLINAFTELENTNTSEMFLTNRKKLKDITLKYDVMSKTRRELAAIVWQARQYYNRFIAGQ